MNDNQEVISGTGDEAKRVVEVHGAGKFDGTFVAAALAAGPGQAYPRLWVKPEPPPDPIYEAAVSLRRITDAGVRKARRTRARLSAVVAGGFKFKPPYILPLDVAHAGGSTRAERRRAELGRK